MTTDEPTITTTEEPPTITTEELPIIPSLIQKTSKMTDIDNPYHLENSDNPRTVLVSDLLTTENHATWSRAMQRALRAKGKIGFINGTLPHPSSTDPLFSSWERCNDMVVS